MAQTRVTGLKNQHQYPFMQLATTMHFPRVCIDTFSKKSKTKNTTVYTFDGTLFVSKASMTHFSRGGRLARLFNLDPKTKAPINEVDLCGFWKDTVIEVFRILHSTHYDHHRIPEPLFGQLLAFAKKYRCFTIRDLTMEALFDMIQAWDISDDVPRDHPNYCKRNSSNRSRIIEFFLLMVKYTNYHAEKWRCWFHLIIQVDCDTVFQYEEQLPRDFYMAIFSFQAAKLLTTYRECARPTHIAKPGVEDAIPLNNCHCSQCWDLIKNSPEVSQICLQKICPKAARVCAICQHRMCESHFRESICQGHLDGRIYHVFCHKKADQFGLGACFCYKAKAADTYFRRYVQDQRSVGSNLK